MSNRDHDHDQAERHAERQALIEFHLHGPGRAVVDVLTGLLATYVNVGRYADPHSPACVAATQVVMAALDEDRLSDMLPLMGTLGSAVAQDNYPCFFMTVSAMAFSVAETAEAVLGASADQSLVIVRHLPRFAERLWATMQHDYQAFLAGEVDKFLDGVA